MWQTRTLLLLPSYSFFCCRKISSMSSFSVNLARNVTKVFEKFRELTGKKVTSFLTKITSFPQIDYNVIRINYDQKTAIFFPYDFMEFFQQFCFITGKIYWDDGHTTEFSTTNERIRREKRRSPCLSHLLLREQTTAPLSLKSLLLQLLNLMTQLSVTVLALITQVARWCRRRCSPRRPASPFKIFSWVSFTLSIFITKCTFQNQIWEVGIWSKDLTTRKIRSIGCPI